MNYKDNKNYQLAAVQLEVLGNKFDKFQGGGKDGVLQFSAFSEAPDPENPDGKFKFLCGVFGDKFALALNLKNAAFKNQDLYEVIMIAALAIQDEAQKIADSQTLESQQLKEATDIANEMMQ
jgi:hypothetical protein